MNRPGFDVFLFTRSSSWWINCKSWGTFKLQIIHSLAYSRIAWKSHEKIGNFVNKLVNQPGCLCILMSHWHFLNAETPILLRGGGKKLSQPLWPLRGSKLLWCIYPCRCEPDFFLNTLGIVPHAVDFSALARQLIGWLETRPHPTANWRLCELMGLGMNAKPGDLCWVTIHSGKQKLGEESFGVCFFRNKNGWNTGTWESWRA